MKSRAMALVAVAVLIGAGIALLWFNSKHSPQASSSPQRQVSSAAEGNNTSAESNDLSSNAPTRAALDEILLRLTLTLDDALIEYVASVPVVCASTHSDGTVHPLPDLILLPGKPAVVSLPAQLAGGSARFDIAPTLRYESQSVTVTVPLDARDLTADIRLVAHPQASGVVQSVSGETTDCTQIRFVELGLSASVDGAGRFVLGPVAPPRDGATAGYLNPRIELESQTYRPVLVSSFELLPNLGWKDIIVVAGRTATLRVVDQRPQSERGAIAVQVASIAPYMRQSQPSQVAVSSDSSFGLLALNAMPRYQPAAAADGASEFTEVLADVGLNVLTAAPHEARYGWVRPGGVLAARSGVDAQPLVLTAGEIRSVTLQSAQVIVQGWVVDEAGKPVPQAEIVVERLNASAFDRYAADHEGFFTFSFDDPVSASSSLRLSAMSGWLNGAKRNPIDPKLAFAAASPAAELNIDGPGVYDVKLTVVASLFIQGRLVNEAGNPQSGYATAVHATLAGSGRVGSQLLSSASAQVPNSGAFRLGPLAAGDYELTVSPPLSVGLGALVKRTVAAGTDMGDVIVPSAAVHDVRIEIEGIADDASPLLLWTVPASAIGGGVTEPQDPIGYVVASRLPRFPNETPGGMIGSGTWCRQQRLKSLGGGKWEVARAKLLPGRYYFLVVGRSPQGVIPPTLLGPAELPEAGSNLAYAFPAYCQTQVVNQGSEPLRVSIQSSAGDPLSFMLPDCSVGKALELAPKQNQALAIPAGQGFVVVAQRQGGSAMREQVPAGTTTHRVEF